MAATLVMPTQFKNKNLNQQINEIIVSEELESENESQSQQLKIESDTEDKKKTNERPEASNNYEILNTLIGFSKKTSMIEKRFEVPKNESQSIIPLLDT